MGSATEAVPDLPLATATGSVLNVTPSGGFLPCLHRFDFVCESCLFCNYCCFFALLCGSYPPWALPRGFAHVAAFALSSLWLPMPLLGDVSVFLLTRLSVFTSGLHVFLRRECCRFLRLAVVCAFVFLRQTVMASEQFIEAAISGLFGHAIFTLNPHVYCGLSLLFIILFLSIFLFLPHLLNPLFMVFLRIGLKVRLLCSPCLHGPVVSSPWCGRGWVLILVLLFISYRILYMSCNYTPPSVHPCAEGGKFQKTERWDLVGIASG